MSEKDDDSKNDRSTAESARRLLLAGIGAYGRAFMEAQEALKDVRGKSSDVFDDLVQKGEMMEMAFEHKSKQMGQQIKDKTGVGTLSIDDRIKKMRSRLVKTRGNDGDDVHSRIDALEAKVEHLTHMLEAQSSSAKKTTAAKKATPAKKATTRKKPAKAKPTTRTKKA